MLRLPGLEPQHDDDLTAAESDDDGDLANIDVDAGQTESAAATVGDAVEAGRRQQWIAALSTHRRAVAVVGTIALLILGLAVTAGVVKWQQASLRANANARDESVQAAKDATVAMLSYEPSSAAKQLGEARNLLTGAFHDSYVQLTDDVVIPGAQQKQITASATVPAAASVMADAHRAVVLVFVNQTTTVGGGAPTDMASSVKVTLDKIGGRWLISEFEPI